MTDPRGPVLRELAPPEIEAILLDNSVGRIAYSFHDRVDIEPISYVYHDGWIYGRTGEGTKLATVKRNRWVAFEVEEVEDHLHWRSVVVQGTFYILTGSETPEDRRALTRAIELLRAVLPETVGEDDPFPTRDRIFRISVQEVRGRAAGEAGPR